jgi:hypothetical protein
VRAQAYDNVLETLYFVRLSVVYQITELNNVRPLRGVHALAILGGKSGGFGVKDHELHGFCLIWMESVVCCLVVIVQIIQINFLNNFQI